MALIFTEAVIGKLPTTRKLAAPLLQRWASMPGDEGVSFRNQLEEAASMVPVECRPRVLGPLGERPGTDDQVRAAVGVLVLAKTLSDLGWRVEYEPEFEGQTPDLRITKGPTQFVVEVRRIPGEFQTPTDIAMMRLRDALSGETTRTPIDVLAVSISGSSSLKPLVRYIKRVLAGPHPEGVLTFNEGGVFLSFEIVDEPFSCDMPIIFGWSGGFSYGDDRTEVRAAIQEKLGKYKLPLVVALDFFHPTLPFETTQDVLLGATAFSIPISLDGGPSGAPTLTRLPDGLLVERGHRGQRARARLQALLPFHLPHGPDGRFQFYGRILANPLLEEPLLLEEFAPMPRLVVSKSRPGHMEYVVHDDKKPGEGELVRWHHVP